MLLLWYNTKFLSILLCYVESGLENMLYEYYTTPLLVLESAGRTERKNKRVMIVSFFVFCFLEATDCHFSADIHCYRVYVLCYDSAENFEAESF